MRIFKQHVRRWWQYPREIGDRSEHRAVSFLELFYDLVYVVLIAELAHGLAVHLDWKHLGEYFFLFIIVWWSWFNGMSYHDLHGNNDVRTRVFTFIQMICVAAMAAFAHGAMGDTSVPFALAYSAFQLTLAFLWWRAGVHNPVHQRISNPYSFAFLLTAALFIISVFLPQPVRSYLWTVPVLISITLPAAMFWLGRYDETAKRELDRIRIVSPSMVERFGLFTIIVLGEVVVGVVSGLGNHHHLTWLVGGVAFMGMLIAASLWWVYFDFISYRIPKPATKSVTSWTYLHLPLTAAIAAVGAAILNVIELSPEPLTESARWLLIGSVGVTLLCVALMLFTIQITAEHHPAYIAGGRAMLFSLIPLLLLGSTPLPTIVLLLLVIVVLLVTVYYGLRAWLELMVSQEMTV